MLLQLASGAFPLDAALCEAIGVPMDKLKWTSPFSRHRSSLSHPTQSGARRAEGGAQEAEPEPAGHARSPSPPPEDVLPCGWRPRCGSGGSEATPSRTVDVEGEVWATAVALAWLEHSSAHFFTEWEMVAAKASVWLSGQDVPEGRDLASVKAAANQLFIILRHWDENLQLNMLCYNPNSV